MQKDGNNSQNMKRSNWALLLELLATERANTRIELSRQTGLSKMTVTNIVDRFLSARLFKTGDEQETGNVGRRAQMITPSPIGPCVMGIYLARNGLHGILCDVSLSAQVERHIALQNETYESLTEKLRAMCTTLMEAATQPIWGVGVATIGPLDIVNGVMLNPHEFYGITDYPIRDILFECTGFQAFVENDMNAAALAELYYGVGRPYSTFLYIGLTAGVGSGIIYDRRLYQQGNGLAGELGHTGIDRLGLPCPCGRRGCLERYVSIPVLCQVFREATGVEATFAQYCMMGTKEVSLIMDRAVDALCYALLNQVNMLNPQAIIIGHEGAYLPARSLARFSEIINAQKLWGKFSRVVVDLAQFAKQAPLYGAAAVVLSQWFSGNLPEQLVQVLQYRNKGEST